MTSVESRSSGNEADMPIVNHESKQLKRKKNDFRLRRTNLKSLDLTSHPLSDPKPHEALFSPTESL
jgi:hypothetical protein